jgi:predicted nucleic acid-binding protein
MRLLVDTSVAIDHLRGDPRAVGLLEASARAGHELWSATIVRTEVRAGMRKGEERATGAFLEALRWQDVTVEIADRAGDLARRYLKSHPGVDTVDYVIAATAEALDARLLTLSTRHFPMFADLAPAYE